VAASPPPPPPPPTSCRISWHFQTPTERRKAMHRHLQKHHRLLNPKPVSPRPPSSYLALALFPKCRAMPPSLALPQATALQAGSKKAGEIAVLQRMGNWLLLTYPLIPPPPPLTLSLATASSPPPLSIKQSLMRAACVRPFITTGNALCRSCSFEAELRFRRADAFAELQVIPTPPHLPALQRQFPLQLRRSRLALQPTPRGSQNRSSLAAFCDVSWRL
jgi:hypothetical protein